MGRKKYSSAPIIEEMDRLSISELSPLLKSATDNSSLFYETPDALPGFDELSIQDTSEPGIFYISGIYNGLILRIKVVIVTCSYSHPRYFFICNMTGLRVSHLYRTASGIYMSRYELNASYRVQREHRAPFFLISRVRDLRKKADDFIDRGESWKSYQTNRKADLMEKQFAIEKIEYFSKHINSMREKIGS